MGTAKKICILTDFPRPSAAAVGRPFEGWEAQFLQTKLLKAGLIPSEDIIYESLLSYCPKDKNLYNVTEVERTELERALTERLNEKNPEIIITLGEWALNFLTGNESLEKWHLSPLATTAQFVTRKCIPTFHPDRVMREFPVHLFVELSLMRAKEWRDQPELFSYELNYKINPPLEDTISYLREVVSKAETIAVDTETGQGQINTVGFAVSPTEAIAIGVLPDKFSAESHYKVWEEIRKILENPAIGKIFQNGPYDVAYFSRYGIQVRGYHHDTMWAQKFLWPEYEMGLDSIARFYLRRPYWKDDGKSWNNIRDWPKHFQYNCSDTTGTLAAYFEQRKDLEARGLSDLFYNYVMRMHEPVLEMSFSGIPFNEIRLKELQKEVDLKLTELTTEIRKETFEHFNPRSGKQIKDFLKSKKYVIPKAYDGVKKEWKESTDRKSLKKLRLKYPKDSLLGKLLDFSTLQKVKSSYLSFGYDRDCRMRFSLNPVGTSTGRWSSKKDPWGRGMNAQTVPGGGKGTNIKKLFQSSPGKVFLQCDLKQAESRFVAYDSADYNLIKMLEDPTKDLHKYVAAEIFQKPETEITKQERQLGKASGHGANYSMREDTFIESCLLAHDLVLTKKEATNILEAYHRLFPGIRQWQMRIRKEVAQNRRLTTPLGRDRYFYGRLDDDMFRESYAYRPQSTVPDVINHLMFYLIDQRSEGRCEFTLLIQTHDSLLLEVPEDQIDRLAGYCLETKVWHPRIELSGGGLLIPTDVEIGHVWGELKQYKIPEANKQNTTDSK